MSGTITDWERERFSARTADDIDALPETPEPPYTFDGGDNGDNHNDLVALHGRLYGGLAVQLLWRRSTNETYITVALGNETPYTFPVDGKDALDAFYHPYAYRTLPAS